MSTSSHYYLRLVVAVAVFWLITRLPGAAQFGQGPINNLDLIQIYVDGNGQRNKQAEQERIKANQSLVDSGAASVLDLTAPREALVDFDRGLSLMKEQKSRDATKPLQKAIKAYPKFVSAHVNLGIAYLDLNDATRAKAEFETAVKLDDKFARSFLNLGVLLLNQQDFADAEPLLEKASLLRPKDVKILSALARAQYGNHQYQRTLETVQQAHALDHKEFAEVHYVGAAAAMALKDFDTMQRELTVFLSEDPANPLAPNARNNLEILARNKEAGDPAATFSMQDAAASGGTQPPKTFANSERLHLQLAELEGDATRDCDECTPEDKADAASDGQDVATNAAPAISRPATAPSPWTIRSSVDEVAQFFAVTHHGRKVSGLQLADVKILDNDKPPSRIIEFLPQAKLPLRLALLIDTSSSVKGRFQFEKGAAAGLVAKLMKNSSDLGFVGGFSNKIDITQDFTADPQQLTAGLEKLVSGGGTRLFDSVSLACRKLEDQPEQQRVARVLVVLTDGEDNSSLRRLRQTISDAERSGVTVYAVSTKQGNGAKTDADRVLEEMAKRSGGEALFPGDATLLGKAFEKVADLVTSSYLVVYTPANFVPDGSYRPIRITAEKERTHLRVQARKGYYARREAPRATN